MTKDKTPVPTESQEQQTLFRWASLQSGKYPELRFMFHIPNGGQRGRVTAAILKGEGVRRGVPDIFLPAPRGGFCGLFIEMKRRKGGRISVEQKKWMDALTAQGYACRVCRGYEEAMDVILSYLRQTGKEG